MNRRNFVVIALAAALAGRQPRGLILSAAMWRSRGLPGLMSASALI